MIELDVEKYVEQSRTSARSALPIVPVHDHYVNHPSKNLTPARLASLLYRAETGDICAQYELFTDMMEKDPTLYAVFETRASAVLTKTWEILPFGESERKAKKQAEWVKDVLDNLSRSDNLLIGSESSLYLDFEGLLRYLLQAVPYGFAAAGLMWDTKSWTLKAAKCYEHKHFTWGDWSKSGTNEFKPYQLRIRTEDELAYGEEIEPGQFIVHIPKTRNVLPSRFGLLRLLSWWYLFKNYGVRSMLQYAESHGMPLRVGYYDAASEDDRTVLQKAIRELGTDAAALISSASKIEFIQPQRDSDIHDRLILLINQEYSKAVLGHASTTESTPGKLGKEDQAEQVQYFRIESDARALESTINSQLIAPMCVFKDGAVNVRFKIRYEPEEDLNQKADRYVKLGAIVPISTKHIYETFDLPEPDEDEETTTAHQGDPLAAMLSASAGAAASAAKNSRFVNSATSRRQVRLQRAIAARAAVEAETERAINDAQPIYASLLDGVNPRSENIEEQIRANLPDFRDDMERYLSERFEKAGELALSGMGLPAKMLENKAKSKWRFDLADDAAIDFLSWQAFTVSVIEGEVFAASLAVTMHDALKSGLLEGKTKRQFFEEVLDSAGVGRVNKGHLTTIFRTNMATASNASKLFAFERNRDSFPGWEFMAIQDNVTTDECIALDGRKFAHGDNRYWPPIHFNCRSVGSPIDRSEWADEGYEPQEPGVELPEGFTNTAVRDFEKWVDEQKSGNSEISKLITKETK